MSRLRALLVEDTDLVASGLERALSDGGIEVAGRAETLSEALAQPLPDVVLLDLGLPDICRLQTVSAMRGAWPTMPILVITVYMNVDIALWVYRDGAAGFVAKDVKAPALAKALRTIDGGEPFLLPELASGLLSRSPPLGRRRLIGLETEALGLIAEGLDLDGVASALHRSRRAVSGLLKSALETLAVPVLSAGELRALFAIEMGLTIAASARLLGMNKKNFGAYLTSVRQKIDLPPGERGPLSAFVNRLHVGCQIPLEKHIDTAPTGRPRNPNVV